MSNAEKILGRVREALKEKAPPPGSHGLTAHGAGPGEMRRWLPAVGEGYEPQMALFRKNAEELRADFRELNGRDEMAGLLRELRDFEMWKRVGSHAGELTKAACEALDLPVTWTDKPYDVNELEKCDVAITECDALVAQTGSVLVTSRSAGGRALSVLPPHHVVVARRRQLVADLPEAFEILKGKYAANYPSFIGFITGPSRTGDIERILVLGAHGPKKLTIICM